MIGTTAVHGMAIATTAAVATGIKTATKGMSGGAIAPRQFF
jgi:hypothetical protein